MYLDEIDLDPGAEHNKHKSPEGLSVCVNAPLNIPAIRY